MPAVCLFDLARFIDPDTAATRFDFLAWGDIGAAFTPGNAPVIRKVLAMDGVDGGVQTSTARGEAIMQIPWLISKQASWDALRDAFAALAVELDRPTNVFEFKFTGDPAGSYLADTFRAEIPSLLSTPAPQPPVALLTVAPILISLPRVYQLRGAGAYV